MQALRLVNLRTFVFHPEIHLQGSEKFFRAQSIKVFHYPVVVKNSELTGLEAYCHEIVVLFCTVVVGVLLLFLGSHERSSGRAVVAVSNIKTGHLGKFGGNGLDVGLITDYPKLMTEAVYRSNEVIFRFRIGVTCEQLVKHFIVGIGKEYGFDIGIVDTHMLHTILFFVTTGQFVLLDMATDIVVHKGSNHKTILRLSIHGLGIDVIVFIGILYQPSPLLKLSEVFGSLFVHTRVILGSALWKVYLRLDDMIQAFLVVTCFAPCFF